MDNIVMEWIRWLLMAAAAILNAGVDFIIEKFRGESGFVQGFLMALAVGLVIGTISSRLLYWRHQMQSFFRPPVHVIQSRGPTPAQSYASCITAFAKIGLVGVILLVLLIAMLTQRFTS